MLDRQQDQDTMHEVPGGGIDKPEGKATFAWPSVPFKLTAEFVVEASGAAKYLQQTHLLPEERDLFLTILTTPEAVNRMCHIGIVSGFDSNRGLFEGQFSGFAGEDILESILPYLPDKDQEFWRRSMSESPDITSDRLLFMAVAFETVLKRMAIEDMTTGEAVPLRGRDAGVKG